MLDAERMIEAERVAQRELAPELLIARVRRHAGLGPDVGEMGEFHGVAMIISCRSPDERGANGVAPLFFFASRSIQMRNLEEAPHVPKVVTLLPNIFGNISEHLSGIGVPYGIGSSNIRLVG